MQFSARITIKMTIDHSVPETKPKSDTSSMIKVSTLFVPGNCEWLTKDAQCIVPEMHNIIQCQK